MKLATVSHEGRRYAVVVAGELVHEVPGHSVGDLVTLGLDRALEIGAAALTAPGVPLAVVSLELPYKPPSTATS